MNVEAPKVVESDSKPPVDDSKVVESDLKPPEASRLPRISGVEAVGLVAVVAALGWAYEPNLRYLLQAWEQPDYTHGYLVLPIALVILWKRWREAGTVELTPWWPGWLLVVAALVSREYFYEAGKTWLEALTMMVVVIGLVMARLGWRVMLKIWPAFAFLCFLYPLPPQLNSALSQPLQSLATSASCAFLKFTGLWVMPEGNVILVGNEKLEVAAACNGLSMLMSLAATVSAAACLIPMTTLKRVALLVSIIPIALGSNVLRIAATAWCYNKFGAEVGKNYVHDWAGWLMMPTALLLVWLELTIISWVVVETDAVDSGDRLGLDLLTRGPQAEARP
jgi:exosortase